jgi:hypothetical protein
MSLIQWKQIDPELRQNGNITGSLRLSGSFFLNDVNILEEIVQSGIFRQTGSFWSTTNNLQITGSLGIELDGEEDEFYISVTGSKKVEVNTEGVLILHPFEYTPTPVTGGLLYSGSNEFFLGL